MNFSFIDFMQKGDDNISMTGSDDSDSDVTADTEPNNLSTISSKHNTSPASLNTDVKYNSVYHNSGRFLKYKWR